MKNTDRIVSLLKNAALHPESYLDPPSPVTLKCYLDGVRTGFFAAHGVLNFSGWVDLWIAAVERRGWEVNTLFENLLRQMSERGLSEAEILQELLAIEIEAWSGF